MPQTPQSDPANQPRSDGELGAMPSGPAPEPMQPIETPPGPAPEPVQPIETPPGGPNGPMPTPMPV